MEDTADAAAAALPDDAVREILVRVVDPADLFRCGTTCKRWRVLVADLSFLCRRWPADSPKSSSVLGFFAPQRRDREPVFVPAPQSPLGIGRCSLSSFFTGAAGFLDRAEPLTTRRGLLLVRLCHRSSAGAIHLAVCDPLAGTCYVLPPLKCSRYMSTACYAILTGADLCSRGQNQLPGYSTFFRVLIIGDNQAVLLKDSSSTSSKYDLHMFSSNESSWTAPRRCFNHGGIMNPGKQRSAVVCHGTAHWLFKSRSSYYTLQVSADTGHISSTKLSIRLDNFDSTPWLSIAINGEPSLVRLRRQGTQVENWTCRDDAWLCTGMFQLGPRQNFNYGAMPVWVGERSGKLLFVDSHVHIADLETGAIEDVTAQFSGLNNMASVPFEVDWMALFSSRLGRQSTT